MSSKTEVLWVFGPGGVTTSMSVHKSGCDFCKSNELFSAHVFCGSNECRHDVKPLEIRDGGRGGCCCV